MIFKKEMIKILRQVFLNQYNGATIISWLIQYRYVIAVAVIVLLCILFLCFEKVRITICGTLLCISITMILLGFFSKIENDMMLFRFSVMIGRGAVIAFCVCLIIATLYNRDQDPWKYSKQIMWQGINIYLELLMVCTVVLIPVLIYFKLKSENEEMDDETDRNRQA